MTRRLATAFLLACVSLFPSLAFAQQNGSIAGRVTDTTGSILPGSSVYR